MYVSSGFALLNTRDHSSAATPALAVFADTSRRQLLQLGAALASTALLPAGAQAAKGAWSGVMHDQTGSCTHAQQGWPVDAAGRRYHQLTTVQNAQQTAEGQLFTMWYALLDLLC